MRIDMNTVILRPWAIWHMLMTSRSQSFFGRTRVTHKVVTFNRKLGVTTCVTIKYTTGA